MSDTSHTEVLVIGGGPGGYPAAIRAAQNGAEVTLVEAGALGGVCLNEGCIPSKGLLEAAESVHRAGELLGSELDGHAAFAAARRRNDRSVGALRSGIHQLLAAAGVRVVSGRAAFSSPKRVEVVRAEGRTETMTFGNAIVAVGSSPMRIPGIEGPQVVTARDVLELDQLPASAAVLGGGAIGLELASLLCRFGVRVSVVELLQRVLPEVDRRLTENLLRSLAKEGVQVMLGHRAVDARGDRLEVQQVDQADAKPRDVAAELVVAAAGRRPNSDGLGLDAAGVTADARGAITVDARGRTSNHSIFAVGDVTPGPGLAHRATAEGLRAADVVTGRAPAAAPLVIPSVVYTDPAVVAVGYSEEGAAAAGIEVSTHRFPLAANGRNVATGDAPGEVLLVTERASGLVVGVQAVGHGVEGIAQVAATAIELGANIEDLAAIVAPHPTIGESLMEVAHLAQGRPVHLPARPATTRKAS